MDIEILKNNVFSYVGNVITGEMILTILKKAISYVPKVNQIYPAHNIAIPAIQGIALNSDNEVLQNMFYAQLIKAIDKTKQDQCHPAFPKILGELSNEEIKFLYLISASKEEIKYKSKTLQSVDEIDSTFMSNYSLENLSNYLLHGSYLGLIISPKDQSGGFALSFFILKLTKFGEKFMQACLNEETERLLQKQIEDLV